MGDEKTTYIILGRSTVDWADRLDDGDVRPAAPVGQSWDLVGVIDIDGSSKDDAVDAYCELTLTETGEEVPEGTVLKAVSARNWGSFEEPPIRYERRRLRGRAG